MHRSLVWSAALALFASCAALLIPGGAQAASAEAALLAVGALSALAGHRWGSLIILAAHVPLAGRVLPLIGGSAIDARGMLLIAVVLITLIPTLWRSLALVRQLMAEVWPGGSPRLRQAGVMVVVLLLSVALVAPALSESSVASNLIARLATR